MKPIKTYADGKPHYVIKEPDGSYTINCKKGEVTMSTRTLGMVGKSFRTASEAFKDAEYATAIQRPENAQYGSFWSFICALIAVGIFGYGFWLTISH
jgi:hypothetical protein